MNKEKSCYFQIVKPDEMLMIIPKGDPTDTEFREICEAFEGCRECQFVLCRDDFKFIIAPKETPIKVIREKKQ